ncbi:MAG: uncharacterized protein A8A55_0937 [Amphiamblys sp. WSBS2006]|nr:MAG: uncharacterized protein A8A55_0937 [Amphiamblys sp. WSBS2006]
MRIACLLVGSVLTPALQQTYIPYGGTFNQLESLENMLEEAELRGRTLFVPPIVPSEHDWHSECGDWSDYFCMDRLQPTASIKLVFLRADREKFRKSRFVRSQQRQSFTECVSYSKWRTLSTLGMTARNYTARYGLRFLVRHDYWLDDKPRVGEIGDSGALLCVAQPKHIAGSTRDIFSWIPFTEEIEKTVAKTTAAIRKGSLVLAVHWRGGDFKTACRNKEEFSRCYQSGAVLKEKIEHEKRRLERGGRAVVVVVVTDESDEALSREKLRRFAPQTDSLFPVLLDFCFMSNADFFLGNRHSSVSLMAARRRKKKGLPTRFL